MSACVHFLCLFLCPVLSAVTNLDWIGWTRLASSSGMVCSPVVCLALCTSAPLGVLAGIGKLSTADGKAFADPEVLRRLTSSVSCALDEAAAALTRMRAENTLNAGQADKYVSPTPLPPRPAHNDLLPINEPRALPRHCFTSQLWAVPVLTCHSGGNCSSLVIFSRSLAEACSDGDVNAVRKLLDEGRSVNEHTEEGESLLCLACSAGYYELAQVPGHTEAWLACLLVFDSAVSI